MKKIILSALLLGACQFVPGSDQQKISAAEKRVAEQLRDPAGAQFRNSRVKDGWVCGEVNGKNAYGGYAGFQRFVVGPDSVSLDEITKENETAHKYFEVLWISCG